MHVAAVDPCPALPRPSCPCSQINSAPARGPDHFPFAGFRDSGISTQGIPKSLEFMCKTKVGCHGQQYYN